MVYDGHCIFCTTGAGFVHRFDKQNRTRFAQAQGKTGQRLYAHFGWNSRDFETNILLVDGIAHTKWASIAAFGRAMGGYWKMLNLFDLVPDSVGDPIYDFVARNRFRIFGRSKDCHVPSPEMRARMVE